MARPWSATICQCYPSIPPTLDKAARSFQGTPLDTLQVNFQLYSSLIHMYLHQENYINALPTCSAGVGRTGTLICVDIALEQAAREGVVDIAGIVSKIRKQRMKMVQTTVSWSDAQRTTL